MASIQKDSEIPTQKDVKLSRKSSFIYDGILVSEITNEDDEAIGEKSMETHPEYDEHALSVPPNKGMNSTIEFKNSQCRRSLYGEPLDAQKIEEIFKVEDEQDENGGLIWRALILPADFDKKFAETGKLKMLANNHYDAKNNCIKARRGMLAVTEIDFFSSLTRIDGNGKNPRWFFSGVLNGWPGLTCLELIEIEYKGNFPSWSEHWHSSKGREPTYPNANTMTTVRATLRAPSWTAYGWSRESPGYFLWFESQATVPRVMYGTNILKTFEKDRLISGDPSCRCIKVHNIAHRYSVGEKEGLKDRHLYHMLSLLEWDHGKYCTVIELGILNGLTGYAGKSNWIEDKDDTNNSMIRCIPFEMVAPWKDSLPELRCIDVPAKSLDEHLAFMKRFTGKCDRFVDVQNTFSHVVRLTFNTREHIAQYLLNYIRRERTYSEIKNNCQTFTSDFSAFLAGKKDVQPYHPVNRIKYRNKAYYFLYDGSMYPTG